MEAAGLRAAELETETERLQQLTEKLEEDLLAADTGHRGSSGGNGGAEGEVAPPFGCHDTVEPK